MNVFLVQIGKRRPTPKPNEEMKEEEKERFTPPPRRGANQRKNEQGPDPKDLQQLLLAMGGGSFMVLDCKIFVEAVTVSFCLLLEDTVYRNFVSLLGIAASSSINLLIVKEEDKERHKTCWHLKVGKQATFKPARQLCRDR